MVENDHRDRRKEKHFMGPSFPLSQPEEKDRGGVSARRSLQEITEWRCGWKRGKKTGILSKYRNKGEGAWCQRKSYELKEIGGSKFGLKKRKK